MRSHTPRTAGQRFDALIAVAIATACLTLIIVSPQWRVELAAAGEFAYIRVDANRNNQISFDDSSDQTSAAQPFRFWLNNDRDREGVYRGESDEQDDAKPRVQEPSDSDDLVIANDRDLEDFTRLHIRPPTEFDPNATQWMCTLQFTASAPITYPAGAVINVWEAVKPGIEYLIDEGTADAQRLVHYRDIVGIDHETVVPRSLFANKDRSAHLIFEAHQESRGYLTARFYRAGQIVGDDRVYLDLKDVKRMYDHFTVGDTIHMTPGAILQTAVPVKFAGKDQRREDPPETRDYILLVHGWRMKPWERRAFAETAFKRLWHRGYRGTFGLFSWPTEWQRPPWGIIADPINYDRSEQKAFVSARGLAGLLLTLNAQFPGSVRVLAHSMGNIVVGEALRQYVNLELSTSHSGPIVHTYIASQAAVPAHSYDASAPPVIREAKQRIPNVYAEYPDDVGVEYFHSVHEAVSGKMANYYNEQDFALEKYSLNQRFKPVQSLLLPGFAVTYKYEARHSPTESGFVRMTLGSRTSLTFPEDRYEIFAFAAPAYSKALGEQEDIKGPFDELVDLQKEFSFGSQGRGHSAQFRSTFWKRYPYWDKVLRTFGL